MNDDARRARVLTLVDPSVGRGLEVGPSFSPFVRKSSGADVCVVDHLSTDALREKYSGHGVDAAGIEPVDIVWNGGSLADACHERGPFDYVIASHVLEHIADPLRFLADCESLLSPGGIVSLVLPDHRLCFDYFRPPTTIGQWVDARFDARSIHTPGTVLDHWVHAVQRGAIQWSAETTDPLTMVHVRADVDDAFATACAAQEYVDVHAWVFHPASFRFLIDMARSFDFITLEIAYAHDTVGCEFYVSLRRPLTDAPPADRDGPFETRLAQLRVVRAAVDAGTPAPMTVAPNRSVARSVLSAARRAPRRVRRIR